MGLLLDRRRMNAASEVFNLTSQSVDNNLAQYDDNEAVCYHESGHAVSAIILKVRFDLVSVIRSDEYQTDGRVAFGDHPCDWRLVNGSSIDHALNYCIFLMAGMAAQLRWQGNEADLKACGCNDRDALDTACVFIAAKNSIAARADSREVKLIKAWAWREACLMMANPRAWRAVCSLARYLYTSEQGTATESEVAKVVAAEKAGYKPTRGIAGITRVTTVAVTSP
ncbi:hypothetical protein [Bradyrhizobium diazoefficiens]|uniref:Peptidase M41 domain-containing protein n=1 Tax=Bradyrhizobium diazoefficiens TaxID=1355477 RepID=A0A810C5I4_9BRAD|nr:hypothetical protein XF9B_51980 [Bradyrhizobium diazoefficiens]BCF01324.1 hypothetical protein XF11B_53440 [Bradyrhizobium diazoefficiens]BCF09860.1 hypothetical protein XF12B_52330 [Bradyrhizobium diazoefficiens]BCF62359.1 hypothetical protein XF18B_53070 [Bradyrhizobium diazoefficiens]